MTNRERQKKNDPRQYQADLLGNQLEQPPQVPGRRRGKNGTGCINGQAYAQQRLFSGEEMRVPFPDAPINKIPDRLGMTKDPGTLFSRPEPAPQGTQSTFFPASEETTNAATHQPQIQEASKEPSLAFGEYNGWINRPTWSVYTVMTSYATTYQALRRMASQNPGGRGNIRQAVIGSVEHWREGKPIPDEEASRILVQDFLLNGVRRVEWTPVLDTLRGERETLPDDANELTTLAYQLLQSTNWQALVKNAPSLTDADTQVMGWVEDQCLTWIASPDARRSTGNVGQFANTILDIYFQAVQWQDVTNALRAEQEGGQ